MLITTITGERKLRHPLGLAPFSEIRTVAHQDDYPFSYDLEDIDFIKYIERRTGYDYTTEAHFWFWIHPEYRHDSLAWNCTKAIIQDVWNIYVRENGKRI